MPERSSIPERLDPNPREKAAYIREMSRMLAAMASNAHLFGLSAVLRAAEHEAARAVERMSERQ